MVEKIRENNKEYYKCEECKLVYAHRKYAKKCEDWCRKNNSCNLEITKYAINKNEKNI